MLADPDRGLIDGDPDLVQDAIHKERDWLAAGVGRDYTTVSRQVAKLESLGLAERRQNPVDRRVNEAVVTPKSKAMTNKIDAARERIALAVFASWETAEVNNLVRLMRKFADVLGGATASARLGAHRNDS